MSYNQKVLNLISLNPEAFYNFSQAFERNGEAHNEEVDYLDEFISAIAERYPAGEFSAKEMAEILIEAFIAECFSWGVIAEEYA